MTQYCWITYLITLWISDLIDRSQMVEIDVSNDGRMMETTITEIYNLVFLKVQY